MHPVRTVVKTKQGSEIYRCIEATIFVAGAKSSKNKFAGKFVLVL